MLYVTADGLLTPLGRSQILAYLRPLARRGVQFHVVSLEPERELREEGDALRRELELAGLRWSPAPFAVGGGLAQITGNVRRLSGLVRGALQEERVDLVHARAFVPAAVAWAATRSVPYVFDMRGYWIDERAEERRLFHHAALYRLGKALETRLLRDAAAVVTLTRLQAAQVAARGPTGARDAYVVPTCADYDMFDPAAAAGVPGDMKALLAGKLVVGFVGSVNASYRVPESLALFRHLHELRPDSHLLCVSAQPDALRSGIREAGLPPGSFSVVSSPHAQMPAWLARMHWGLLLLSTSFAKAGSMPTKLAEFLAMGVRPIQHGCNPEVSDLVKQYGSGIVLDGLDAESLRRAAEHVAAAPLSVEETTRARSLSRTELGLEAGVATYLTLIDRVTGRAA